VKLRYYLRGLGIGMIVTSLLMGMALKDGQPLSDAEIRAKAMELGMVEGDSRTLADIQGAQGSGMPSEDASLPAESPEPEEEPDSASDSSAAPTASPILPISTPRPTIAPSGPIIMVTPKPTVTPEGSVEIIITSGESSYTVSKALMEAGLVEDASDFDRYLVDNGYSRRISTGTYEIPLDSTQEEIAKIITRSR
jgi:Predicted periplasmic solute-binding protein